MTKLVRSFLVIIVVCVFTGCSVRVSGTAVPDTSTTGATLTDALLLNGEFPVNEYIVRSTSVPPDPTLDNATTTPAECRDKDKATQISNDRGELASARASAVGLTAVEVIQRGNGDFGLWRDFLASCADFDARLNDGFWHVHSEQFEVSAFGASNAIGVRNVLSQPAQHIDTTIIMVTDGDMHLMTGITVQNQDAASSSEAINFTTKALDRKRKVLR